MWCCNFEGGTAFLLLEEGGGGGNLECGWCGVVSTVEKGPESRGGEGWTGLVLMAMKITTRLGLLGGKPGAGNKAGK